jgi:hypothetical protein
MPIIDNQERKARLLLTTGTIVLAEIHGICIRSGYPCGICQIGQAKMICIEFEDGWYEYYPTILQDRSSGTLAYRHSKYTPRTTGSPNETFVPLAGGRRLKREYLSQQQNLLNQYHELILELLLYPEKREMIKEKEEALWRQCSK